MLELKIVKPNLIVNQNKQEKLFDKVTNNSSTKISKDGRTIVRKPRITNEKAKIVGAPYISSKPTNNFFKVDKN